MDESMSYSAILKRMLDSVPKSFDRREGSVIRDALAPAAMEIARACGRIDMFIDECFADTASREYLARRAAERGLTPYPATKAVRRGEFAPETADIPIGTRFGLNALNYAVTEKIADGVYSLACETAGSAGNRDSGALIPVDYISGISSATLLDVLIPGEDDEEVEHFRKRYFDSLDVQAFGGNIQDYKNKANGIAGVGGVKVYPAWNGGGTVKLVIIGSDGKPPSQTLVETAQNVFNEIAPIGHTVTVAGAEETAVNLSFSLTYQNGWNGDAVRGAVNSAISGYFRDLVQVWDNSAAIIIRIVKIESLLLDINGIIDVSGTKLNGFAQNLYLPENAIPVTGEINYV